MLLLEIIKKYYPRATEVELKIYKRLSIYWRVLLCSIFMGQNGWVVLKNQSKKESSDFVASSIPVRVLGYRAKF
jgi:exosome complex RNA-binding protein Rrp4